LRWGVPVAPDGAMTVPPSIGYDRLPSGSTMDLRQMLNRAARAAEILGMPSGLKLKLREPAFDTGPFRVCTRLRASGIDPATVFDVGANRGQFALAARTIFPRATVHSYEPTSEAFAKLKELTRRQPGISAHQAALGARAGTQTMELASNSESSSFLPQHANHQTAYPEITSPGRETVPLRTLEAELGRLSPAGPLLLKLDVQGYEAEVLTGAGEALSRFRWIVLETSTQPLYQGQVLFEELVEKLKASGFHFASPVDIHFAASSGGLVQFDALFDRSPDEASLAR
jgi:FkbM family methyltransferase